MKAYKKIILLGLLAWLCVCVAEGIYFQDPYAGLSSIFALPGARWEKFFPKAEVAGDIAVVSFFVILICLPIFAWKTRSIPLAIVFSCLLLGSSVYGWFWVRAIGVDIDAELSQTVGKTVHVEMHCIDFWDQNKRWPSNYDELVKFVGESNVDTLAPSDRVSFRQLENGGLGIYTVIQGQSNSMEIGKPSIQHVSQTDTNSSQ